MNILVTGFKPWSTHGLNPSETAANFAANLGFPTHVFPVSYPAIDEAFLWKTFDAVLLFGLSAKREEITLERYAYNEFDKTLLDVDGLCPNRDIIEPNGPKSLQTSLPIVALSDSFYPKAFQTISPSTRAGIYATTPISTPSAVTKGRRYSSISPFSAKALAKAIPSGRSLL